MSEDFNVDEYDKINVRKRPTSLMARSSKVVMVREQDEFGHWRDRIKMSQIKFGDVEKGVFLDSYRKWGRMGEAAAEVGVSTQCVRAQIHNDQEFAEALLICEEEYKEKLIGHHQDLVFNGTVKKSYDRNGMLVSEETIYPIRLIEMELKKHDAGYREKQEVAVTHSGGVLVAPSEMGTIDDWEKKFAAMPVISPDPDKVE